MATLKDTSTDMIDYNHYFSKRVSSLKPGPIARALNLLSHGQDIISFAAGSPDSTLLPTEVLGELTNNIVQKYGKEILQYGHMQGFLPLRQTFAKQLSDQGVACRAEDINLTTGASGAINSLCVAFLNKGDTVLVETPSYTLAIEAFRTFDATVTPIACDDEGMIPSDLETALKKGGVKFIYVLPNFQNPTGRTISLARRKSIAALAQKYDALIIEDDIYGSLRYSGQPLPPIHSFAPHRTLLIGSVSKMFAPAMRIGVMVLPPVVMEKIVCLKPSLDLQGSVYTQALTDEFFRTGQAANYLARVHSHYSKKLSLMLEALQTHMPEGFHWNKPEGGMFIWVNGPDGLDAERLLEKAIAAGVAFIPGATFFIEPENHRHHFRLNFATPSAEQITRGVAILAEVCRQSLGQIKEPSLPNPLHTITTI
ncbi:MAG TPA: PLP-dependent aminotransferase family protein [Verrucomicrobiae bacterium]|nr:PLP-dependent aminotransferase family protein [Verrucomicrobiae bacterium]